MSPSQHPSSPLGLLGKLAVVSLLLVSGVEALTAAEWRSRSIYQVMTDRFATANGTNPRCVTTDLVYCGGSWGGIVNKLDYIQGMGFDAVWISPVSQQVTNASAAGQAYHSYWPTNLLKLSGTAASLTALSTALHARGMALMVDIIVNDVAFPLEVSTSKFDPTIGNPPGKTGLGLYGPLDSLDYYHTACTINTASQTSIEQCWFSYPASMELADVKTELPYVRTTLNAHVKDLVSTYAIDGLRIDAAGHVEQSFYPGYVSAANTFAMGEILSGVASYVAAYQNYMTSTLNYPTYFPQLRAFTSKTSTVWDLKDMINSVNSAFADPTVLGSFAANHDNPRPRSVTTDTSLLKNLYAYNFVSDGIPIWYYGEEQGAKGGDDPNNREALWTLGSSAYDTTAVFYKYAATLNAIRRAAAAASTTFYTTKTTINDASIASTIVLDKYPMLSFLNNRGASAATYTIASVTTKYAAGTTLVDVLSCSKVTVDSSKKISVSIFSGLPEIYLPLSAVPSSLCPSLNSDSLSCASKSAARVAVASPTASS